MIETILRANLFTGLGTLIFGVLMYEFKRMRENQQKRKELLREKAAFAQTLMYQINYNGCLNKRKIVCKTTIQERKMPFKTFPCLDADLEKLYQADIIIRQYFKEVCLEFNGFFILFCELNALLSEMVLLKYDEITIENFEEAYAIYYKNILELFDSIMSKLDKYLK